MQIFAQKLFRTGSRLTTTFVGWFILTRTPEEPRKQIHPPFAAMQNSHKCNQQHGWHLGRSTCSLHCRGESETQEPWQLTRASCMLELTAFIIQPLAQTQLEILAESASLPQLHIAQEMRWHPTVLCQYQHMCTATSAKSVPGCCANHSQLGWLMCYLAQKLPIRGGAIYIHTKLKATQFFRGSPNCMDSIGGVCKVFMHSFVVKVAFVRYQF